MSQDALGLLKHLKTARARWPFPDALLHMAVPRMKIMDSTCFPPSNACIISSTTFNQWKCDMISDHRFLCMDSLLFSDFISICFLGHGAYNFQSSLIRRVFLPTLLSHSLSFDYTSLLREWHVWTIPLFLHRNIAPYHPWLFSGIMVWFLIVGCVGLPVHAFQTPRVFLLNVWRLPFCSLIPLNPSHYSTIYTDPLKSHEHMKINPIRLCFPHLWKFQGMHDCVLYLIHVQPTWLLIWD